MNHILIVATQDLVKKNERMNGEISSLKLKIDDLNTELRQTKMEHDIKESEQLQTLMADNKRLVKDFKGLLIILKWNLLSNNLTFVALFLDYS